MNDRDKKAFIARAMRYELDRAVMAFGVLQDMANDYKNLVPGDIQLMCCLSSVTVAKRWVDDASWAVQRLLQTNLGCAKKKHRRRGSNKK